MARGDRVFQRGNKLWVVVKRPNGKWVNMPTPYRVGEERLAKQVVRVVDRQVASKVIDGVVYILSLLPELPTRLKAGYTSRSIERRLTNYRTACPQAKLLALWPGNRDLERLLLNALPGRISPEVFDVPDIEHALMIGDDLLGARLLR